MSTNDEVREALGRDAEPDEAFLALLEQVGDADIIAGPPVPQGGGVSVPRAGRITVEYSFLDLVDDLGHGTRAEWARIFAAALSDPVLRATVARAARLVDPDFADAGTWWLAAVARMPPIAPAVAEVEASSPTDPWAEFDAALELAGPDIERSGVLDLPEAELMDLAERATRDQRVLMRGHTARAPDQHPQELLQQAPEANTK